MDKAYLEEPPHKLSWECSHSVGRLMAEIFEDLEKVCIARLDERGRIYLPKKVREHIRIKLGDKLYIKMLDDHIAVYTAHAVRKRLQSI